MKVQLGGGFVFRKYGIKSLPQSKVANGNDNVPMDRDKTKPFFVNLRKKSVFVGHFGALLEEKKREENCSDFALIPCFGQ